MGRTVNGIHLDPHRGYRERCAPRDGEHGFQLVIGETDLRVTAVSPLPEGFKDALAARVRTLRGELEALTTQVKELEAAVEAEEESVGDGAGGEE